MICFYPIFKFLLRDIVQNFSFLPVYLRIGCFQVFAGFLDAAATRRGEGNNCLSFEVVCLHEGVDDCWASVPPDGEVRNLLILPEIILLAQLFLFLWWQRLKVASSTRAEVNLPAPEATD